MRSAIEINHSQLPLDGRYGGQPVEQIHGAVVFFARPQRDALPRDWPLSAPGEHPEQHRRREAVRLPGRPMDDRILAADRSNRQRLCREIAEGIRGRGVRRQDERTFLLARCGELVPLPRRAGVALPRRPAAAPGGDQGSQVPLNDMNPALGSWPSSNNPPSESDPIRAALLHNLEKRTRGQAEFDRIVAADSKGMVDAGTSMAAFAASMTPVGQPRDQGDVSVLGDPSWERIRSTLDSFSFAAMPMPAVPKSRGWCSALKRTRRSILSRSTCLFNKTRSGHGRDRPQRRADARPERQAGEAVGAEERKAGSGRWLQTEAADDAQMPSTRPRCIRVLNSGSTETTREASSKLDASSPGWPARRRPSGRRRRRQRGRCVTPREAWGAGLR